MPARKNKVGLLDLPPEILTEIFSYLSLTDLAQGVRRTCRHFYNLSWSVPLWRSMKITTMNTEGKFGLSQKDFYQSMLDQKCLKNSDCYEQEQQIDMLRGNGLTVRHSVTSVCGPRKYCMHAEESTSMIGQMAYPNLCRLELALKSLQQLTTLSMYGGLLHLRLWLLQRDQSVVKHLFDVLRKDLTNLQSLKLDFYFNVEPHSDAALSIESYFCSGPKLRCIEFWFEVSDAIVEAIMLHCSQLKKLKLGSRITAKAFKAVSKSPNLSMSSLCLLDCASADNRLLRFVSRGFPNLKKVFLFLFPGGDKVNEGLIYLLKRCCQLTHLGLSVGADDGDDAIDDNEEEEEDTEDEKNSDSEMETDTHRKHFLYSLAYDKKQTNLQKLTLYNFSRYLPFYPRIFENHCNLQMVGLEKCVLRENVIQAIADNCPLLESISIKECKGIRLSTRTISALLTLPRLQELSTDERSFVERNQLVRDGPPRRKRKLKSGEMKLEEMTSRLQKLRIPSSSLVFTPERLELFERTCHNLQSLRIEENQHMDDEDLKVILRCCVHLRSLTLSQKFDSAKKRGNPNLTDATLRNIQRYGQQLQILVLTHCPQITINGLAVLAVQSTSLIIFEYVIFPGERKDEHVSVTRELENSLKSKLSKVMWGPSKKVVTRLFSGSKWLGTRVYFFISRRRCSDNAVRSLRSGRKLTLQ